MIERKTISDQVFEYLVDEIKSGNLKPNDKLKPERQLAEELQVSRVVVREAIKSLSKLGIIQTTQGGGNFVSDKPSDILCKIMGIYMMLDEKLLLDYVKIRITMESEAARLAAKNATNFDIKELKTIHNVRLELAKKGENEQNKELLYNYDIKFHLAIARASKNKANELFLNAIFETLRAWQEEIARKEFTTDKTNEMHEDIIKAIEQQDEEKAEILMFEHLSFVYDVLKERIKS